MLRLVRAAFSEAHPSLPFLSSHVFREESRVPVILSLDVARRRVVVARDHELQRARVLRVALELARLQHADGLHVPGRVGVRRMNTWSASVKLETGIGRSSGVGFLATGIWE